MCRSVLINFAPWVWWSTDEEVVTNSTTKSRVLRLLCLVLLAPVFLVFIYGVLAWCVMHISADSSEENRQGSTQVYLNCGEVHSEIILPVTSHDISFRDLITYRLNDSLISEVKYVSFAWGDLHFFKSTPRWEDLTAINALRASIGVDSTALHIQPYFTIPDTTKFISCAVSALNYRRLADFIAGSISMREDGVEFVPGLANGDHDFYVVSNGTYSLFYNCNSWVNDALKSARSPACVWTIFPAGIVNQYAKKNE